MTVIASPTDAWTPTASGLWSAAGNWSLKRAPKAGDLVVIAPAAPLAVTFDPAANVTVAGLALSGATLNLQGAALIVTGAASLAHATVDGVKPLYLHGATTVQGLTLGGASILYNYNTVTQSGGSLSLGDSAASSAAIRNLAGATWTISDASGMTQSAGSTGWRFVNYGTFQKTSGAGTAVIAANFYSNGTVASASGGDIEFDGPRTWLAGTFVGPGMVEYGPDGVASVSTVNVTGSTCQTNWGTVNLVGDMTMHDGSTIMNDAGARWNFAGDVSLLLASGEAAGPVIGGQGIIAKTAGTGVSHVGIDVAAQGTVSVSSGALSFEGASSAFSSTITGAGTFEVGAGAATLNAGAALAVANWTLAGGTTTLGENLAYTKTFTGQAGATLNLGGYGLTLAAGAATFSGLVVEGPGALTLRSGAVVSGLSLGGGAGVHDFGAVRQVSGELTLGDASATDLSALVIGNGGSWQLADTAGIALGADLHGFLNIEASAGSGVLSKSGTGTSVVAPSVLNNGLNIPGGPLPEARGLEVSGGTLDLQRAVSGAGDANIVNNGTLEFDAGVGAGQTIVYSGQSGGVLFLNDLPDFHAGIVGFDAGGVSDVIGVSGDWTFTGAAQTATSTSLGFSRNGVSESLTLTGDYRSGVFDAATGYGGPNGSVTIIGFSPAAL